MGKMEKLTFVLVAITLALTGCSSVDDSGHDNGPIQVHLVQLPDDTTVDCATMGSSIDCDWDNRS